MSQTPYKLPSAGPTRHSLFLPLSLSALFPSPISTYPRRLLPLSHRSAPSSTPPGVANRDSGGGSRTRRGPDPPPLPLLQARHGVAVSARKARGSRARAAPCSPSAARRGAPAARLPPTRTSLFSTPTALGSPPVGIRFDDGGSLRRRHSSLCLGSPTPISLYDGERATAAAALVLPTSTRYRRGAGGPAVVGTPRIERAAPRLRPLLRFLDGRQEWRQREGTGRFRHLSNCPLRGF
jgi:hypothetical protein